ncbi:alpha-amylase MalA [Halobellus marinus]|uniref:alpha-amylase MalA n=1 Tax=Halobellus TaxID=1073986 RepID=UPI0028A5C58A|nr:alpha-amylase MalA [Halobellus sp. DFY28]
MEHPGPPRFIAVGESVQLAPRDPDPDAPYEWRIRSAPVSSTVEPPDGTAVIDFTPDAPGRYTLELDAREKTYTLTIRAFASEFAPGDVGGSASGVSGVSGPQSGSARSVPEHGAVSGSGSGARSGTETGGRPRVQLHGTVDGDELVVWANPLPHPGNEHAGEDLDVEFLVDDRDEVKEGAIQRDGRELRIPISAVGDRVRVHGVAVGETYSVPDTIDFSREVVVDGGESRTVTKPTDTTADDGEIRTDAFVARRPNDPPEWATDVTLYEIYVRGFLGDEAMTEADDPGSEADDPESEAANLGSEAANLGSEADDPGGETGAESDESATATHTDGRSVFDRIADRLDYLEELGVDCLWLTPVLQNDHAPHGYNITDFFSIAEDLGDREDYERFVSAAHDRGMKVLFDLVLNHSARDHPFFQDAYGNPDSEYYDWYDWQDSGEPETYFEWEYIANWNFENLAVRRHLLDAVDTWFEVADGFRCDMAWAVPDTFWQELRDRVKSRDPEFLLLDETIPYVADFHNGMFDMHFDTTLYFTLRQVGRGHADADAVLDAVEGRDEIGFPPHAAFMLYIENHDETRYVVECGDEAAMAAAGALVTLPGVPMLYGGQELGQRGRRDALAWEDAREEFREHYERLLDLRNEIPALGTAGGFSRVSYETDTDRAVAFRRELDDSAYVCVLNFGESPATVTLVEPVDDTDLVTGESLLTADGLEIDDVAVFHAG